MKILEKAKAEAKELFNKEVFKFLLKDFWKKSGRRIVAFVIGSIIYLSFYFKFLKEAWK